MDSEIQTTLPLGSPILAYGESQRAPTKTILALLAGVLVAVGLAALLWANFGWNVNLPEQTVVLAAIHGKTNLPSSFPNIWRHAAEQTSHPLFLGLARQDDVWIPFVVNSRFDAHAGSVIQTDGIFSIQSDAPLQRTVPKKALSLLSLARLASSHDAALSIQFADGTNEETISGFIYGTTWKTDASVVHPLRAAKNADLSLDFTALPGSWEALSPLLTPYPLPLALPVAPTALDWIKGTSTEDVLDLHFGVLPPTSTQEILNAAQAIFRHRPYTLLDQTESQELILPTIEPNTTTSSTPSTPPTTDGGIYETTFGAALNAPLEETQCGNGTPVMHASSKTLNLLVERLDLPFALFSNSLTIAEDQGKAIFCLK